MDREKYNKVLDNGLIFYNYKEPLIKIPEKEGVGYYGAILSTQDGTGVQNIFFSEEGKIPTETDCRRGLIPSSENYRRHFGSLMNARKLAGLPEFTPTRYGKYNVK